MIAQSQPNHIFMQLGDLCHNEQSFDVEVFIFSALKIVENRKKLLLHLLKIILTMKKGLRISLLIVLVLIVAGGIVGYKMYNKPHADVNEMEGIPVTAEALYKAFESNEAQANQTYLSKVVEVTGTIGEVKHQDTITYVNLTFPDAMMGGVQITIDKAFRKEAEMLKTGDPATIKGFCNGYLMDVIVNNGVIVKK